MVVERVILNYLSYYSNFTEKLTYAILDFEKRESTQDTHTQHTSLDLSSSSTSSSAAEAKYKKITK